MAKKKKIKKPKPAPKQTSPDTSNEYESLLSEGGEVVSENTETGVVVINHPIRGYVKVKK